MFCNQLLYFYVFSGLYKDDAIWKVFWFNNQPATESQDVFASITELVRLGRGLR